MKGVLFFDIDGTLVDSARHESMPYESSMRAVEQAKRNGYICMINSGRNLGQLRNYDALGFDGYVFSDGAGVCLAGKEPVITPIPSDMVKELITQVEECGGSLVLSVQDGAYAAEEQYELIMNAAAAMAEKQPDKKMEDILREFCMYPLEAWKNDAVLEIDVLFHAEEDRQKWLGMKNPELHYIFTGTTYGIDGLLMGEVTYRDVTKGMGCRKAVEMLGGDMKYTYAFGDSMNDADMLKECAYGICMGNGDPELKKIADYVTGDISDDGLCAAMRHFHIID